MGTLIKLMKKRVSYSRLREHIRFNGLALCMSLASQLPVVVASPHHLNGINRSLHLPFSFSASTASLYHSLSQVRKLAHQSGHSLTTRLKQLVMGFGSGALGARIAAHTVLHVQKLFPNTLIPSSLIASQLLGVLANSHRSESLLCLNTIGMLTHFNDDNATTSALILLSSLSGTDAHFQAGVRGFLISQLISFGTGQIYSPVLSGGLCGIINSLLTPLEGS